MSNDNFVEQLKERAKKYYAGCTYCQNISGDLVGFIVAETAREIKESSSDASFSHTAHRLMVDKCDDLIQQAEGK